MGQFASPDYPHTPYFTPYQWEISPRCHWKLRPQVSNMSAIWLTFRNFFLGKRESAGYCRYFGHKINKLTSASLEGRQRKTVVCLFLCFVFFYNNTYKKVCFVTVRKRTPWHQNLFVLFICFVFVLVFCLFFQTSAIIISTRSLATDLTFRKFYLL